MTLRRSRHLRLFAFRLFETLLNAPSQIVVDSAHLRVEVDERALQIQMPKTRHPPEAWPAQWKIMSSYGVASRSIICITPVYCSLVKPNIVIGTRIAIVPPLCPVHLVGKD